MASIKLKGDTSGEITISAPAVAGTNTISLQATTGTLATTTQVDNVYNSLGVRNLIINGDMQIAQRGTSHTQSANAGGFHTVDRFSYRRSGAWSGVTAVELSQESSGGPNDFPYFLRYAPTGSDATTASDTSMYIDYKIEGQTLTHLNLGTSSAKSLTISFYVRSSVTGTFTLQVSGADFTRFITDYTINSANTWERKIINIPAPTSGSFPTSANMGLALALFISADKTSSIYATSTLNAWTNYGADKRWSANQTDAITTSSGQTFDITGLQLEVGDTATPFEHRPYDMELARCKRYYTKVSGTVFHANIYHGYEFSSPMRATPSMTLSVGSTAGIANTGWRGIHNATSALTYYADAEL